MRQVHGERKERKTNTDIHVRPRAFSQGVDLLELFAIQYLFELVQFVLPDASRICWRTCDTTL